MEGAEATGLVGWMCPVGIGVSHLSKIPNVSNGLFFVLIKS